MPCKHSQAEWWRWRLGKGRHGFGPPSPSCNVSTLGTPEEFCETSTHTVSPPPPTHPDSLRGWCLCAPSLPGSRLPPGSRKRTWGGLILCVPLWLYPIPLSHLPGSPLEHRIPNQAFPGEENVLLKPASFMSNMLLEDVFGCSLWKMKTFGETILKVTILLMAARSYKVMQLCVTIRKKSMPVTQTCFIYLFIFHLLHVFQSHTNILVSSRPADAPLWFTVGHIPPAQFNLKATPQPSSTSLLYNELKVWHKKMKTICWNPISASDNTLSIQEVV